MTAVYAQTLKPGDWIVRPDDGKPDRVQAVNTNVVTGVTNLYLKYAGNTEVGRELPVSLANMEEVESS